MKPFLTSGSKKYFHPSDYICAAVILKRGKISKLVQATTTQFEPY